MRGTAARKMGVDASEIGRPKVLAVSNPCFSYRSKLAMNTEELSIASLQRLHCILICSELLTKALEIGKLFPFLSLAGFFCALAAMRPDRSTSRLLFRYHWSKLSSCCLAADSDWALIWSLKRWERWDFEAMCVKRWETSENWGLFGQRVHCSWIEVSLCLAFGMMKNPAYRSV